jgi:hypothetical protein
MPIDFRKNANVLAAVHEVATPKQRTPSDPYVVDGYELHARPDLVDRLKHLMASTPKRSWSLLSEYRCSAHLLDASSLPLEVLIRCFCFCQKRKLGVNLTQNTAGNGGKDSPGQEADLTPRRMKTS